MDIVVKHILQEMKAGLSTGNVSNDGFYTAEIKRIDFDNIFIAGGACRDFFFKKAPKDYDIFVPVTVVKSKKKGNRPAYADFFMNSLADTFKPCSYTFEEGADRYKDMDTLICKYDAKIIGIELDIMFYDSTVFKTPKDYMGTFDFGINQVMYDGKDYISTEAFQKDLEGKKATLVNVDSMKNLPKLMRKAEMLQLNYGLEFDSTALVINNKKG